MEACPRLLSGNHYQVQNDLALNSKLLKTRQGFPKVVLVLLLSQVNPVENLFSVESVQFLQSSDVSRANCELYKISMQLVFLC